MFALLTIVVGITTADMADASVVLSSLRVNSMREPNSIDDPRPHFSFRIDAAGQRAVVTQGYEIQVHRVHANGTTVMVWASGVVMTNQTQFISWPESAPALVSDADYSWQTRAYPGNFFAHLSFSPCNRYRAFVTLQAMVCHGCTLLSRT